ncbi:MAG: 4-(cytidine 5'-diphospho)-2-C-methyl-D-erythritol kinase [Chitinophagaceae bacterium]
MIVFPNCKINLGLYIVNKRTDGYHDLETVFYPVPLKDALEIIPLSAEKKGTIEFTQTGLVIEGDPNNNICAKAYQLMQQHFPELPGLKIHLHKQIPMGAGLGGGSADGALLLATVNNKFNLEIAAEQLSKMALELGSDCPFFLYNKPCLAFGRGERLAPLDFTLADYKLVLINPGIPISTAQAFKGVSPQPNSLSLKEIIMSPPTSWKNKLKNQFEETVFPQFPSLKDLKEELYQLGAVYASMSGSGSTLYGIFEKTYSLPADFSSRHSFCREYLLP